MSYNSTSGMKVPKSTYTAQHRIPLGTLSTNCLMGYGWRTTCMPSFKLSCPTTPFSKWKMSPLHHKKHVEQQEFNGHI